MKARRMTIQDNLRPRQIKVVGPDDFAVGPASEIDPLEVFRDPGFGLYCFDMPKGEALFVRCPDPGAVESAPFYYQAQAEHGVELAAMPLETFHGLAEAVPSRGRRLLLIQSVGRCGSTLLSKVLEATPDVCSLSEPDELTQLTRLVVTEQATREDAHALLRSACSWRSNRKENWVALKFRAEVCGLADIFVAEFPDAQYIFLYRNAVSWMGSNLVSNPGLNLQEDAEYAVENWSSMVPLVAEYRRKGLLKTRAQVRQLCWISCMERYFMFREAGVPLEALRYEDLAVSPQAVLHELYRRCGLPDPGPAQVEAVLARDSQAGTMFDREERRKASQPMTPEIEGQVRDIVRQRPLLGDVDVILPGTLLPSNL